MHQAAKKPKTQRNPREADEEPLAASFPKSWLLHEELLLEPAALLKDKPRFRCIMENQS